MDLRKISFLLTVFCITTIVAEDFSESTQSTTDMDESRTDQPQTEDETVDPGTYSNYRNYDNKPYYYHPAGDDTSDNHWNQPYPVRHRRSPQSQYDHGPYQVYRRGSLKHPRPYELFRVGRVIFVNSHGPRNYARPQHPSG